MSLEIVKYNKQRNEMQTSVYIAGMTCRLHIKDRPIPFFQIDIIPSTILTFFLRYRYQYLYCDVIELTGKSRDLADQVQGCLTL